MSQHVVGRRGFNGPLSWVMSACLGLAGGAAIGLVVPGQYPEAPRAPALRAPAEPAGVVEHGAGDGVHTASAGEERAPTTEHPATEPGPAFAVDPTPHAPEAHGPAPVIPAWLVAPFGLLLASIALMPFIRPGFWHHHYPDVALMLGGFVAGYYLTAFGQAGYLPGESYGEHKMLHTGLEYYAFIALIGSLFVASGGVHIDVRGRGGPVVNTMLLAVGAVLANIMGTTGASMLLIRPFMRVNRGRLRPIHIVMFIFVVSNCGGALTPIGDPPLYLGFLKGVPFDWTLTHLLPMWAACIGMLLAIFWVIDSRITQIDPWPHPGLQTGVHVTGLPAMLALALIIAGVFIDPLLKTHAGIEGLPIGPTFQIAVAVAAYFIADREILAANEFTFGPVKEVALLFAGIFATMTPALAFLAAHSDRLGLDSPTAFYFGTGALSAVLDNAPTYLNFLQVAFGENEISPDSVQAFLAAPAGVQSLTAISLGAVFFGAMTYIGNGPNFMVKAIAEASGLKMPTFLGYLARATLLLLPVLIAVWAIFLR